MDARLQNILDSFETNNLTSLHPLLATLRFPDSETGLMQPVTLDDHWSMEDMYRLETPPEVVWMDARQVGKSFGIISFGDIYTTHRSNTRFLYVCPRFSQAKTLACDTLKPIIEGSLFKDFVAPAGCEQSMLKREWWNNSAMIFTYAFLNADRARGIPNIQAVFFDESQDTLEENIKVIKQSTASSKRPPRFIYTGTPKSLENGHTTRWNKSSQSVIRVICPRCNKENIGTPDMHLERMCHPVLRVICAHCGRPLNLDQGIAEGWCHRVHLKPENLSFCMGIHVPQPLHPLHYRDETKWDLLMESIFSYDTEKLWNEIYGWPCGAEAQLITRAEMEWAQVWENDNSEDGLMARVFDKRGKRKFRFVTVGIDWGGGGGPGSRSYTVMCVVGLRADSDKLEVIYVKKFPKSMDTRTGALRAVQLAFKVKADFIAHDACGAGAQNELFITQAGWIKKRILPFAYTPNTSQHIIRPLVPSDGYRDGFAIDKARSIVVLCEMIKCRKVLLPRIATAWEQVIGDEHDNHLLADFVNIYKDTSHSNRSADLSFIATKGDRSDDTVHAINYGCSAIWTAQKTYPNAMDDINWMKVDAMLDETDDVDPLAGLDHNKREDLKVIIKKWMQGKSMPTSQLD